MIIKVSSHIDWLESSESSDINRPSISKSAMDAFEAVVHKRAANLRALGMSDDQIAVKFNLQKDYISNLLKPVTKVACACESRPEPTPKDNYADGALQAYNALHNIKNSKEFNNKPILAHKILASRKGDITDIGGPRRQIKFDSSNSIWDSEVLSRQSKIKGNDEKLKTKKEKIAQQREEMKEISRYQTIDGKSLKEYIENNDLTKGNSIQSLSGKESYSYDKKIPINGISIFENSFDKIPEKTEGEKLANKVSKNDRSWLNNTKSLTTKDIFNKMVDSLTGK